MFNEGVGGLLKIKTIHTGVSPDDPQETLSAASQEVSSHDTRWSSQRQHFNMKISQTKSK